MKKKVVLMTTFGLVILIAVIAAALNALFTVTKIDVRFETCSTEGASEAVSLQSKLDEEFLGRSTTFLDLEDIKLAVREYPSFELVSVEKDYPQTVLVQLAERKEVFAYQKENGVYAVFDGNGIYLYDKESNVSRLGGKNVLLDGFTIETMTAGEQVTGEYIPEVLSLTSVFIKELDNVRANIVSIQLLEHRMEGLYFRLQMTEGVYIDVYTPKNHTAEKAEAILAAYRTLSYEEKLYGYFDVMDHVDGEHFTVSRHYDTPAA